MVETHRATFAKYELLTHKIKSGDGRVPLGVGVGLVKEACIYLADSLADYLGAMALKGYGSEGLWL